MNVCVGVLTAVDFIVSFITVALPVALPEDRNTLVGPAAELVHTTRPHVCRNTTFQHSSTRRQETLPHKPQSASCLGAG
jgi:hypothetical protein